MIFSGDHYTTAWVSVSMTSSNPLNHTKALMHAVTVSAPQNDVACPDNVGTMSHDEKARSSVDGRWLNTWVAHPPCIHLDVFLFCLYAIAF